MKARCFVLAVLSVVVDHFAWAALLNNVQRNATLNVSRTGKAAPVQKSQPSKSAKMPVAKVAPVMKGQKSQPNQIVKVPAAKAPPAAASQAEAQAQKMLKQVINNMQAINDTLDQLGETVNETNVTLNQVIDKVLGGAQQGAVALNMVKAAADAVGRFGMESAAEAVTNFADKLVVLLTDFEDKLGTVREKVNCAIDEQVTDFLGVRDQVVGEFTSAIEKVAALSGTDVPSMLLQVDEAMWPFDALFGGKKKDAFDLAEDDILAANASIIKASDYLGEVNVSSIELMTDLVMGTAQSVVAQFQDKCGAAVSAQGEQLPGVLATQANNVCSAPDAVLGQLAPMIAQYEQVLVDSIVKAQDSLQPLFDAVNMLMYMVEMAREDAAAAKNATKS